MTRYAHKRRRKHGLPPGTLVFTGEETSRPIQITVIDYDQDAIHVVTPATLDAVLPYQATPTTSWIDIDGVHEVDVIQRLGTQFGIHPLVLEDIVSTGQRPKVEVHDGYLFFVVRMHTIDDQNRSMQSEQISLIVGPTWVLSFQEGPGDVFDPVRHRLRDDAGHIRERGADYLAYALIDVIVDHYFLVLEHFGDWIEDLEDHVLEDPFDSVRREINTVRRDLILLRRNAWPLRELLSTLDRAETPLLTPDTHRYFRDVYDHAVQVLDIVESMRDVLSGLIDLYMSSLSNRMNEVMKFLTIIGTIFIPLTFIAGIYGMNFDYLPELHWRLGYPLIWLVMLLTAAGLVLYFKRKRWL